MIREYSCPSCGSNLSYIEEKKVFRCEYCGKLFSDEMEEIDLKLVESLRQKKMLTEARHYAELLLEKDPDDFYLNWEWFNTVYTPGPPSRFISANFSNANKMSHLMTGNSLNRLRDTVPDDMVQYIADLEELISLGLDIANDSDRLTVIRKKQRFMSSRQIRSQGASEESKDSNSVTGWGCAIPVIAIILFGLLSKSVRAGLIFIGLIAAFGVFMLIRNKIAAQKAKDPVVSAYDEARGYEKRLEDLKARAGYIREEARTYEDKLFEIISR